MGNQSFLKTKLPNGLQIYHLNDYGTSFTYNEIFERKVYLRNGIKLENGCCVFDIGANIGLFTIFLKSVYPDSQVFSFEPAPPLYKILGLNTKIYNSSVKVYPCGMSQNEGELEFTYYPNYSIMSGFHADLEEDSRLLSLGVRTQIESQLSDSKISDRLINIVSKNKLKSPSKVKCQIRTISSIIDENNLSNIDLLKIDAEKSEIQILRGIKKDDWPKIKQIVLESHSTKDTDLVVSLLKDKGFNIKTQKEDNFVMSSITNIFARKQHL